MTITYLVREVLPPIYKKSILWQYNHNIWCDEMPLPVSKITESWQYNHYICVWGYVTT